MERLYRNIDRLLVSYHYRIDPRAIDPIAYDAGWWTGLFIGTFGLLSAEILASILNHVIK